MGYPIIFHNKSYRFEKSFFDQKTRIVVEDGTGTLPNSLSRYFALSDNSVASLKTPYLFLSRVGTFNDLFDGDSERISYQKIDKEDFKIVIEHLDWSINQKSEFIAMIDTYPTKAEREIKKIMTREWAYQLGILCMTTNFESELMWAHYAKNEGFAIEYDFKLFPAYLGSPIPINYLPIIETIYPENMYEALAYHQICALSKKEFWRYEEEYRFIAHPENEIYFEDPPNKIREVAPNSVSRYQEINVNCILRIHLGPLFFNPILSIHNENGFKVFNDSNDENVERKKMILNTAIEKMIPINWVRPNGNYNLESVGISFDKEKLKEGLYIFNFN